MSESAAAADLRPLLSAALEQTGRVLGAATSGHLDAPTPCTRWTARELINHVVGGAFMFTAVVEGRPVAIDGAVPDFTAGDLSASWADAARGLASAWRADGIMERTLNFPVGPLPAPAGLGLQLVEELTHCWDLAMALGCPDLLEDRLAEAALPIASQIIPDQMRNPEGDPFGPRVTVAGDAPAYAQLAGFMGRHPRG